MRSTFFQQPLEHQIEVEGETWDQGGVIKGKLRIRNMSSEAVSVKTAQVVLAHGLIKSIKEKTDVGWEVQERLIMAQDVSLPSGGEQIHEWSFSLPTDRPIKIQYQRRHPLSSWYWRWNN